MVRTQAFADSDRPGEVCKRYAILPLQPSEGTGGQRPLPHIVADSSAWCGACRLQRRCRNFDSGYECMEWVSGRPDIRFLFVLIFTVSAQYIMHVNGRRAATAQTTQKHHIGQLYSLTGMQAYRYITSINKRGSTLLITMRKQANKPYFKLISDIEHNAGTPLCTGKGVAPRRPTQEDSIRGVAPRRSRSVKPQMGGVWGVAPRRPTQILRDCIFGHCRLFVFACRMKRVCMRVCFALLLDS